MSPLPTIGSGSGISASYLNELIAQTMSVQRQPLLLMQEQKDRLEIQRAVYQDLQSSLGELKSAAEQLKAGSTSVLAQKKATFSEQSIASASGSFAAAVGTYDIAVTSLAQAHRVQSQQQNYADQPLGLSGVFVLGGEQARSVTNPVQPAGTVAGFGVTDLVEGQTELGQGTYHIEIRDNEGAMQFRMVDADGHAITIADAGSADVYTSGWQNLADVQDSTYDTGRGLTVSFGAGPFTEGLRNTGAASVEYQAQGAQITVEAGDTLQDIRDAINEATYADGHGVQATIVNKTLVLTALSTGAAHAITGTDLTGTVLSGTGAAGLGLKGDGDAGDQVANDGWRVTSQAATDAVFTVNNLTVTRSQNSGLTDVIDHVTLNLLAEGETTLTIADDNAAAKNQINSFLTTFNKLTKYLSEKTAVTKNEDGKTYTRGALAGDSAYERLRLDLLSDLNRAVDLGPDALSSVWEIGLGFDFSSLQAKIESTDKLDRMLTENHEKVGELLDAVMNRLIDRVERFTGTKGLLSSSLSGADRQIEDVEKRISDTEARLTAQEELLTRQYGALLSQAADMQAQSSYLTSLYAGINQWG